ncbi:hypothetical protein J437_LFUL005476 [Ladona fulva]|uniref:Mediator of RNA polymerase II transcription subunit 13 n=1 Tax=Ladona fulva TaxID=123851 RepID=A0A8K0JY86_LADFU|nr:hypothetical protein J437_LFUL005476 [Ladona fulva]
MPTLSPHPPLSNTGAGMGGRPATPLESQDRGTPGATPSDLNGPKSVSSVSNQVFSPYPAASSIEANRPVDSVGGVGSQGPASAHSVGNAPPSVPPLPPSTPLPAPALSTSTTVTSNSTTTTSHPSFTIKRPVLSSREYEDALVEEERPWELLYNYITLDAWLNHPVKRFKPSDSGIDNSWSSRSGDLYSFANAHGSTASSPPPIQNGMGQTANGANNFMVVKQEIKQEPMDVDSGLQSQRSSDPYEFDDDVAVPTVSMDGFKRFDSVKDEDASGSGPQQQGQQQRKGGAGPGGQPGGTQFEGAVVATNGPTKCTSGNLFTNEGLQPSYSDLDQIFDNSDDTSSDEALPVPTPPDSNQPVGGPEDTAASSSSNTTSSNPKMSKGGAPSLTASTSTPLTNGGGITVGILRPEELSKMFPTPPSLEHNPIASPCQGDGTQAEMIASGSDVLMIGGGPSSTGSLTPHYKQEIYPNMGSPQEENVEDWSYVYRPPLMYKMVGSSKYAPLTNLPSQSLPPITLPAHLVYKPSWLFPPVSIQQQEKNSHNGSSHPGGIGLGMNSGPNSVGSSAPTHPVSPATTLAGPYSGPDGPGSVGGLLRGGGPSSVNVATPGPPPYEMPSPASNASPYLGKINSMDASGQGTGSSVMGPHGAAPMVAGVRDGTAGSTMPVATVPPPEASSLVVNILLSDSVLNLFRDHNFDSCTLCVCNAGPKVVGNIRGSDAGVYLPDSMSGGTSGISPSNGGSSSDGTSGPAGLEEDPVRCSCGFSAVVNRRLAHGSGIFFEDEVEITGLAATAAVAAMAERKRRSLAHLVDPDGKGQGEVNSSGNTNEKGSSNLASALDHVPQNVIELIREQCMIIRSPSNALVRRVTRLRQPAGPINMGVGGPTAYCNGIGPNSPSINVLELADGNEVTSVALEQGAIALGGLEALSALAGRSHHSSSLIVPNSSEFSCRMEEGQRTACVHNWPYLRARGPHCNQDIVRVMKGLRPLLQDAVQKKCTTHLWDAPYTVSGPLTWRQFHRLAGRGTDDRCEPQPIPSLIVGYEKDWLSLSPYALHYWEKLLLEPYSYARDVAYVVVAPDNEYILQKVRSYFRELSATYEVCRLGRHCPITKVLRDGILRVGKTAALKLAKEPVDDWFNLLGENYTSNMLKLYAQVCRHHLAPHLSQVPMDRTLLDPHEGSGTSSSSSSSSSGVPSNRHPDHRSTSSPMPPPPPSTPDSSGAGSLQPPGSIPDKAPSTPKPEPPDGDASFPRESSASNSGSGPEGCHSNEDDEGEPPAIVVYLVEPFSLTATNEEEEEDLQRLACLGLMRCFTTIISLESILELAKSRDHNKHNDHMRALALSVFSQCRRLMAHTSNIISLESILELAKSRDHNKHNDHMRALALSVFSQCRRLMAHTSNVKSLTGFGPAAAGDLFLKSKDDKNRAHFRLYTPPYVLAPSKDKAESGESFSSSAVGISSMGGGSGMGVVGSGVGGPGSGSSQSADYHHCSVLYVSYCLSGDQRWLLASCIDERGEVFETSSINIEIPNRCKLMIKNASWSYRLRRKKASARRIGLQKLMDWILGVMSQSVQPWRLVVGRIGRIGHGELKGWSWLLSRKSLLKASKHLKELCRQCALGYPGEAPCILSACLVSFEPDSALRLMPDQFTPDERFSQTSVNCALSTPQDVTSTHILVFPTSATTQSSQTAFQEQHINGPELGDDELFSALNDDMPEGIDGMQDFNDIFSTWPEPGGPGVPSPTGSPRRGDSVSQPGSPGGLGNSNQHSPFPCNGTSGRNGSGGLGGETQEEVGTLLQQPLALGYLVSTAPTGPMPSWFWASCPHLEGVCPVFLKNALHLHSPAIQQSSDDILQQQSAVTVHPLDSQYTTDVLRYVMEGYNALSWLALDSNSHDRLSCLPAHIQALMQLYQVASNLV